MNYSLQLIFLEKVGMAGIARLIKLPVVLWVLLASAGVATAQDLGPLKKALGEYQPYDPPRANWGPGFVFTGEVARGRLSKIEEVCPNLYADVEAPQSAAIALPDYNAGDGISEFNIAMLPSKGTSPWYPMLVAIPAREEEQRKAQIAEAQRRRKAEARAAEATRRRPDRAPPRAVDEQSRLAALRQTEEEKQPELAISYYDEAIRLDPKDVTAYVNRADAYRHNGDYDRAISDYDRAISLDPGLAIAYFGRGFAYGRKGDYDRAIADYDQAVRLDPQNARALVLRGDAYSRKGDPGRAASDYNQAITLDPTRPGRSIGVGF
jgi:tetratricopeptide (TPR) repeat protein